MITVKPLREEALRVGFQAMAGRLPADFEFSAFCEQLEGWKVSAFCQGEKPVGMLMTKGDELHVAVLPEVRGKWLSRRLIKEVFDPILAKYGQARTKVAEGNEVGKDFVQRIRAGFADLSFDPTTALIMAGTQLVGGAIGAGAAQSAADTQANAANSATASQRQMFDVQNQQQAPYRQAGYTALGGLLSGLGYGNGAGSGGQTGGKQISMWGQNISGMPTIDSLTAARSAAHQQNYGVAEAPGAETDLIARSLPDAIAQYNAAPEQAAQTGGVTPGYFTHQFGAGDLNANLAPNYQFQLDQGLGATKNAANLQTGLVSGNALKGINDYAQNYAGNAYQQAFNNYGANQSNIFNRLTSIAGLGSAANQQSAGLAGSMSPGIASSIQGAGQAQAAGTVGAANAITGAGNNALGWYSLSKMMNPGGGVAQ